MSRRFHQDGVVLAIVALVAALLVAGLFAVQIAVAGGSAQRERVTDRALAQAREALIAYAVDRPINAVVGPGYLPCPDLDDDGWAESTCGSQSGDSGQAQRLGRLPWKTLGLPDLRDGHGERLWYAVSSKHKGLLNCGASRACLDMSPAAALGTITVRESSGALLHDGRIDEAHRANEGGALAVVIAPGPAMTRTDGVVQSRECGAGDCDSEGRCTIDPPQLAAHCNPVNYLDRAPEARFAYEDNADFIDRNDAAGRALNGNGFIMGPVVLPDGRLAVNDRVSAISYRDVMPRVMARVGLEVSACLRYYASRPGNGGRYPWPTPVCAQRSGSWSGAEGVYFGRIADTPFAAMASRGRLERWWRVSGAGSLGELPTADDACRIAVAPADPGPQRASVPPSPSDEGSTAGLASNGWWSSWKPYVFYALSRAFAPSSADTACDASRCVVVSDASGSPLGPPRPFAVIVAGAAVVRNGFTQHRDGASISDITMWLEDGNAALEGAAGCGRDPPAFSCEAAGTCGRVTSAAASAAFNDVVIAPP